MLRLVFRAVYAILLVGLFLVGAWLAFERSIVGRSVTVPDLTGKPVLDAIRIAHDVGLKVEEQPGRARNDDRVGKDLILAQEPNAGSLAKPSQVVRVVLSLGGKQARVPDLTGLPPRAAALRLARESLQLGTVSWYRDAAARVGVTAQDPEPEAPAGRNGTVEVLTNRGAPEARYVMPDLVGRDAEQARTVLASHGFRVGSARYEAYEGIAANTILKQLPTAGAPISSRDVVSLTVSRPAESAAPVSSR